MWVYNSASNYARTLISIIDAAFKNAINLGYNARIRQAVYTELRLLSVSLNQKGKRIDFMDLYGMICIHSYRHCIVWNRTYYLTATQFTQYLLIYVFSVIRKSGSCRFGRRGSQGTIKAAMDRVYTTFLKTPPELVLTLRTYSHASELFNNYTSIKVITPRASRIGIT